MTEQPVETASPPAARRRGRPPTWGILVFLAALGGLLIVNQLMDTSGPPVEWIENDVDAALAKAGQADRRVLLYLYDPNSPVHERNEREVFSRVWARGPLARAVCCRVDITKHRLLALKYKVGQTPLFVLLAASGKEMGRVDGIAVDERQFRTYIAGPAQHHAADAEAARDTSNGP